VAEANESGADSSSRDTFFESLKNLFPCENTFLDGSFREVIRRIGRGGEENEPFPEVDPAFDRSARDRENAPRSSDAGSDQKCRKVRRVDLSDDAFGWL